MKGPFIYNSDSRRFAIGTHDLHCGDCFEILMAKDKWQPVRIELSHANCQETWYLIGLHNDPAFDHEGRIARFGL